MGLTVGRVLISAFVPADEQFKTPPGLFTTVRLRTRRKRSDRASNPYLQAAAGFPSARTGTAMSPTRIAQRGRRGNSVCPSYALTVQKLDPVVLVQNAGLGHPQVLVHVNRR